MTKRICFEVPHANVREQFQHPRDHRGAAGTKEGNNTVALNGGGISGDKQGQA